MASIGKGNGEVEVFVLHEFDIGFINDQLGCSSAVVERRNVTVEELDKVKETTIVEKQKRICKKRKENTSKADEVGKSDDADSSSDANSEPIDCEYFHDSDYDFSKDDDELIYQKSINDAAQDVSTPLGKSRADHPSSSRAKTSSGEGGREKDFHVYDGEQIGINEDSDSWNSEELNSMCSSSDEDTGVSNKAKFVRFRSEIDMDDPKFYVGLQFGTKNEFKEAVDYHGVKWGKQFTWKKNDSRRMRAVCNSEHCGWFIYASKMADSDTFTIKTVGPPHQCGRTFYHRRVTSSFLSKKYLEFIRLNKRVSVGAFQEKVHKELNVNITRHQVYKTFQKAKVLIHGKYKEQYSKLWDYCDELLKTNPGSTVIMDVATDEITGKDRFHRLYICFEALKRGFREGCRSVVGLDGCHLRGPHPGVLLAAVGMDPNDCIYPVAYAVVETENKSSWKWFVESLKEDLGIYDQQRWAIISDRQKGLGSAIQEILPNVEHRHCVRHLHNNFKKVHPGNSLKDMLWTCARSTYRGRFDNEMEALRQYDEKAHKWLMENTSPYHWSRSHFRSLPKCDILLNNMCESFNLVILEAREKPILGMLENIRIYLMERLRTKREWIKKRTEPICPKIQKKLEKAKEDAAVNIGRFSNDSKFEVTHMYGERFVVDLVERTCSCRRWELTGLPCAHAVSCIALTGELPETFVHPCYSKNSYLKAYQPAINPINGPNGWRKSDMPPVFAPKKMKLPGRPKKARRREPDEQRTNDKGVAKLSKIGITKMSCSKCRQRGHTVRKCPLTAEESSDAAHSRGMFLNKCSRCKEYGHNVRRCPAAEEGGQDMPHNEPGFNMNEHVEYVDVNIQVAETTIVEPAIIVQVTQAEVIDPTPTSHSQKNVPNAGSRGEMKRTKKRANRLLIDEPDDANEE